MQFIVSGQRIAVENFVTGKLYTILWKNDTQVTLTCISIGADCVVFQGEAPLNLFTLTMQNADTIDTIEPTQLGTTNYNNLINKPSINGVDLIGNKTSSQLGIRDVPAIIEADDGKVLTAASDGSYSWQTLPEGTTDYTDLSNKPKINNVTLTGNVSLSDIGAAAASDLAAKQDVIQDLNTIRSGAAAGATAVQPAALDDYATNASVVAGLASKQDSLSSAQLAAVNSGITSADVAQIETNKNNISSFHKPADIYFQETEPTGNIKTDSYWISAETTKQYIKTENMSPSFSEWVDGYINTEGTITAASTTNKEKTSPYIDIGDATTITYSYNDSNAYFPDGGTGTAWRAIGCYAADNTFLSRIGGNGRHAIVTTGANALPEGTKYVRLTLRTYGDTKGIMLNKGTTALPYEPMYIWKDIVNYTSYVRGINHRGYNYIAPENTMPAYILSKKMGFDYVETDISFTADGVAVLLHDSTIDRTSNGTGNIADMTYAQVSQYDFGSWKSEAYAGTKIPTFDEFILFCRNVGLKVYAELKGSPTQAQVDNVCGIVKKYGMENNVSWISFDSTALEKVLTDIPTARVGFIISTATSTAVSTTAALKTSDNEVFLDTSAISDSVISDAITAGVPVELWTVNYKPNIISANSYISGFTSDILNARDVIAKNSLTE